MALHSESEMAFFSQESVSSKNSELNEGALIQLNKATRLPEISREQVQKQEPTQLRYKIRRRE